MEGTLILFVSMVVATLSLLNYYMLVRRKNRLPVNIKKLYFGD